MKLRHEIAPLAAAVGTAAVERQRSHVKLLAYARSLESIVSDLRAELAREKDSVEVKVAEQIIQWSAAYEALRVQVTALERRNREIVLFGKLNDYLQMSTTESEAYSIVADILTQLFPEDSGAVYVLSPSRDMLEASAVWGPRPPANLVIGPSECWAHRRGQVHVAMGNEQRCPHVTADARMYACLPLLAQGETLGILHLLDGTAPDGKAAAERMADKCSLAKAAADSIGLGIANLKLRASMRNLSIRDPLTGLFNRRYMEEALAQELHRTMRNGEQLGVIMIDIDHFKQYNDAFGHDGGDAVLRALGAFFAKHVRGSDIACRYGGEEFVLILSPSTLEGAGQRAEKIRNAAARLRIRHADRDLGAITLSMGVAVFPDHGSAGAAILKAADIALYQAKNGGRDRVVMYCANTESAGGLRIS